MSIENLFKANAEEKMVPDMNLIRKHLMIEGHIQKECLVRILHEVTDVYRAESNMLRI